MRFSEFLLAPVPSFEWSDAPGGMVFAAPIEIKNKNESTELGDIFSIKQFERLQIVDGML